MNKRVFLIFLFFFALSFSGIIFYFFLFTPQNSQAVECCTSPCTTERFAECNSVSTDFCSICSDPSYFYFRCSSIPCTGVCTDFYCDGSCGANCSGIQDPDCSGSCCGDSICNGTENSLTCPGDCPVVPVCGDSICNGTETSVTCPADCPVVPVCGDSVCNGTETSVTCPGDCSGVCTDLDKDGYGNPSSFACSYIGLDCNDGNININPGETDFCGDAIDQDCVGGDSSCSALDVKIINPKNGSEFSTSNFINFDKSITGGVGPYTYEWSSDVNGIFSTSSYAFVSSGFLDLGNQNITLKVSDGNILVSANTISLKILSSSDLSIRTNLYKKEFSKSENFSDFVSVSGGTAPFTYEWSSDIVGVVSNLQNIYAPLSSWPLGSHLITVKVSDSNSQTKTLSENIFVKDMTAELYPSSGHIFYTGDNVYINSSVRGGISPFVYKVESSLDGLLHLSSAVNLNYDYFSTNILSQGVHTFKLTITDSNGAIAETKTQITISPVIPAMITCTSSADCSDSNPCNNDICNNPGLASSFCSHPVINTCSNSDSCCPSVCDYTNDNDCAIVNYDDPAKVLLIFNDKCASDTNKNGVKDSWELMNYYKQKRNIPDNNILAVNPNVGSAGCSYYYYGVSSYPDFYNDIVLAIQNKLSILGEENINYFLLVGLPTRISVTSKAHSNRSLDQALMTLYNIPDSNSYGEYGNYAPYFEASPSVGVDKGHFKHSYKIAGKNMYLVTRINSKQLVDRALYGEKYINNIAGYYNGTGYVDTRYSQYTDAYLDSHYSSFTDSSSYGKGDRMMAFGKRIYDMTGWDYKWEATGKEIGETGAIFTDASSALTAPAAMWYEGWYNYGTYHDVFAWKAGAVAVDLNSNSGQMTSGSSFLKGAFANGLTAGSGVTGEPYLFYHPRPEVLLYYILKGYNFAEASGHSYPVLKWRNISYGDPIYNPNKAKTPMKDTTNPVIVKINESSDISSSDSKIDLFVSLNINTSEPEVATFKLEYGLTTAYGMLINYDEIYSTENTFNLSGLTPGTDYQYRISAKDPVGNLDTSANRSFKTTTLPLVLPTLNISSSLTTGNSPLSINFSSVSSEIPLSYFWNFDDGGVSNLQSPSYLFANKGFYNVSLQTEYSSGIKIYKKLLIIIN